MKVAVPLQVVDQIPFLDRCLRPKVDARENIKVVQILPVCAQQAGIQVTTLLSSKLSGKRHARQYHAPWSAPVDSQQKVRPDRGTMRGTGDVGRGGGNLTYPSLARL